MPFDNTIEPWLARVTIYVVSPAMPKCGGLKRVQEIVEVPSDA